MSAQDIINPRLWDVGKPEAMTAPLRWRKPSHVSVQGVFRDGASFEFADRVFAVMALCPQHTFQILPERPERMAEYLCNATRQESMQLAAQPMLSGRRGPYDISRWPLPNVWHGTSAEDQPRLDERAPHLLRCPSAVRFLSLEPLLGEMKLQLVKWCPTYGDEVRSKIGWVIVGGESGPNARPCDVAWIRSIVSQCKEAGVPCFVKQLGACVEISFEEWNAHTSGGLDGSGRFTLLFQGADRGYWELNNRKGADPAEWPEDLRVRQFPEVRR